MQELTDLFEVFSGMIDPTTGKFFFVPKWRSTLRKQLEYVAQGLLSDCPGMNMCVSCGYDVCLHRERDGDDRKCVACAMHA